MTQVEGFGLGLKGLCSGSPASLLQCSHVSAALIAAAGCTLGLNGKLEELRPSCYFFRTGPSLGPIKPSSIPRSARKHFHSRHSRQPHGSRLGSWSSPRARHSRRQPCVDFATRTSPQCVCLWLSFLQSWVTFDFRTPAPTPDIPKHIAPAKVPERDCSMRDAALGYPSSPEGRVPCLGPSLGPPFTKPRRQDDKGPKKHKNSQKKSFLHPLPSTP